MVRIRESAPRTDRFEATGLSNVLLDDDTWPASLLPTEIFQVCCSPISDKELSGYVAVVGHSGHRQVKRDSAH